MRRTWPRAPDFAESDPKAEVAIRHSPSSPAFLHHNTPRGVGPPASRDLPGEGGVFSSISVRYLVVSLPPDCHRTRPKDTKTRLPEADHRPPFLAF